MTISTEEPTKEVRHRRPVAAVIGDRSATATALEAARALGRALVDHGFRVVTGGSRGVMEAACHGARQSDRYREGDTVGILPTYDGDDANAAVDIVITTGLGHARNVAVVSTADVVIAVGGKSGTLSEVAHAWSLGKTVIALDVPGWGQELAGRGLDSRRPNDIVHGPMAPEEAAAFAAGSVRTDAP